MLAILVKHRFDALDDRVGVRPYQDVVQGPVINGRPEEQFDPIPLRDDTLPEPDSVVTEGLGKSSGGSRSRRPGWYVLRIPIYYLTATKSAATRKLLYQIQHPFRCREVVTAPPQTVRLAAGVPWDV
jgi:hypothetical protein